MIRPLIGLLVSFCLLGSSQAQDFSELKAKYIDLDFILDVDGVELGKPNAMVVVGVPASFSTESYKLDFVVSEVFVDDRGRSLAATHVRLHTKTDGSDWELVGQPTVLSQLNGASASIMESSNDHSVGIVLSAKVIPQESLVARVDAKTPASGQHDH